MAERYEKLDKMRADIEKTKNRIEKMQAELKIREGKLKDAEAEQMLSDIYELSLTPEQLGEFLQKIKAEKFVQNSTARSYAVRNVNSEKKESEGTEDED